MASYARVFVLTLSAITLNASPVRAQSAEGEQGAAAKPSTVAGEGQIHPLASKEEMVRDRFQRFEDRVYRLRELLDQQEPENAAYLDTLGWIYYKQKAYENALVHIRKANGIEDTDPTIADHLGDIYEAIQRH